MKTKNWSIFHANLRDGVFLALWGNYRKKNKFRCRVNTQEKRLVKFREAIWNDWMDPQRLLVNVSEFDYKATNLLSCMTLDVENFHSTVHIKQAKLSTLEYYWSFGLTTKESIKRTTEWTAYYHTSRRSWYPKPEETIPFSRVPNIKPLVVAQMSQADCHLLRNWASSYGAAVRQRTVRQETMMAKHSTLPKFIHQR